MKLLQSAALGAACLCLTACLNSGLPTLGEVPHFTLTNQQGQKYESTAALANKVGRTIKVIVDQSAGKKATGRSSADAPEIDGVVHLKSKLPIQAGEIVTAKVTGSDEYDLTATVV